MNEKSPMTTKELFNKICGILKEKGKLPDILDYYLADDHSPVPITNEEFCLKNNLDYGASEGIYLDIWMECYKNGERCMHGLGTFKTLETGDGDMHTMAALLADFIIEETAYVNANLDDFTWEGADVHMFNEKGEKIGWAYSCRTMESALKKKDKLLSKFPKVIVRDNATRKETVYERENRMESENRGQRTVGGSHATQQENDRDRARKSAHDDFEKTMQGSLKELSLADCKKIYVPGFVDVSALGCLDGLEYELWNVICQYLNLFGIEMDDDEPDWATVKEVQETIITLLERTGVKFRWGE